MRKTTLGISVLFGLGLASTASADPVQGQGYDVDGDGMIEADEGSYAGDPAYAYDDGAYDNGAYDDGAYDTSNDGSYDTSNYEYDTDDCDHADQSWFTPSVSFPVVRTVVVHPRAGFVWIEGRWRWNGYEWVWREGHYARARANFNYVQGRWFSDSGRYRFTPGYWRPIPRRVIVRNQRVVRNVVRNAGWRQRPNRVVIRNQVVVRNQPRRQVQVRDHRDDRRDRRIEQRLQRRDQRQDQRREQRQSRRDRARDRRDRR